MGLKWLAVVGLLVSGCTAGDEVAQVSSASERLIYGGVITDTPEIGFLNTYRSPCTATLIGPQAIITAAHCFDYRTVLNNTDQTTVFEFDNRQKILDIVGFVSLTVDRSNHHSDIAVARLSYPVDPQRDGVVWRDLATVAPSDPYESMRLFGYGCGNFVFLKDGTPTCTPESDFTILRAADIDWAPFAGDRTLTTEETGQLVQTVQGDSGGPLLDQSGKIVLMTSGTTYHKQTVDGPVIRTTEHYSDIPANFDRISDALAQLGLR